MSDRIQCCFERYEKKYLLTDEQLEKVSAGIQAYVHPDEFGTYSICNIYYDTDNFQLIRASLEKPVYKEKLRMRSYGVPTDESRVFVELKKKYDGVVYKRRTVMAAADAVAYLRDGVLPEDENQICHEIDWFMQSYRPTAKVFIAYDRTAFAGRDDPELRITFDRNLRWRDTALDLRAGDYGAPLLPPEQTLMEIKIPGAAPTWLAHLLSECGVFATSFSKYGACYKQNLLGRGICDKPQTPQIAAVRVCA
ncbi:MAG: polyphosphate polymerase domain-containing protein [Oscillospiraceae bacterium]|nr:polyphosphate polymerase domain-containing protein [Oscillospiraceae bacterium]MCD8129547.1 polyphosphate polymerase domain-containing protein [Oscillospiraceae bacterium]MCD8358876.1 polyphosphate polymerase domain-containing protein [Oscillospiraceae bacterium]MCD8389079.1 polyphosphate polymerase domain-containing protein [Oscillospiraceae bacterium]